MLNALYVRWNAIYSIYPPFWRTTWRRRGMTWSQAAQTVTPSISFHELINFLLRSSTLEGDWEQASCSKIDYIPKFIGLRSGEDGGQSSFDQKDLKSWEEIDGETVCATCDQFILRLPLLSAKRVDIFRKLYFIWHTTH